VCVCVWGGGRRGGRVCCVRCGFVLVGGKAAKQKRRRLTPHRTPHTNTPHITAQLPPTLLSRFDLIYLVLDKVDEGEDRR